MIFIIKKIFLTFLSVITLLQIVIAQDDKTVTLSVIGQGKTQDEAKQSALRNAIEQAFGTFISSKTEILNDELVKDEIISVSNGNIQKFEIISEVQIPEGGYAITLKATVSVSKLTSFVESKGINVEFKGSLFAFNINQQILNEKNEIKAIEDLCKVVKTLSDVSFNYTLQVNDPISVNASNEQWKIPMYISVYANSNINNIANYLISTLKGISLSNDEANNYIKLGKSVYPLSFAASTTDYSYILLRKSLSILHILNTMYYFSHSLLNFKISNGLTEWKIDTYPDNLLYVYDYNFRLFILEENHRGTAYFDYLKESLFYPYVNQTYCRFGETKEIPKTDCLGMSISFTITLDHANILNKYIYRTPASHYSETQIIPEEFNTKFIPYNKKNTTIISTEFKFQDQFSFVKNLKDVILNQQSGVVISFIGIDEKTELVRFYYDDIRSIEEINQIKGYAIIKVGN